MENEYGIAWVNQVKKPFIFEKLMVRGKNRGKLRVWLTRGRDAGGNIIRGNRILISMTSVVEFPSNFPTDDGEGE